MTTELANDVTGAPPVGISAWLDDIVCGDSREHSKCLADESVDLVLTDPPFGIGFKYAHGYEDNREEYLVLLDWIIAESNRVVKPGGFCFVFQSVQRLRETMPRFPENSRLFGACKNFVQIKPTPMQYALDPVMVWQKAGDGAELAGGKDYHVANTAWTNANPNGRVKFHSCPRPLDTIEYIVNAFSPKGGLVVDWFMGSGTTAVAAKRNGRHFAGWEINEEIAAEARQRVRETKTPHEQTTLELGEATSSNDKLTDRREENP